MIVPYVCKNCQSYVPDGSLKYMNECFCGASIDKKDVEIQTEALKRAKEREENDTKR